jgi:1-deoxy-D-xylulose-5-phosphate synthase
MVLKAYKESGLLVTLEENLIYGGAGSALLEFLVERGLSPRKMKIKGLRSIPRIGSREHLLRKAGLDAQSLAREVQLLLGKVGEKMLSNA